MGRSVYTPPNPITSDILPLGFSLDDVTRGVCLGFFNDGTIGIIDGTQSFPMIPLGIAANNARAGELIYAQVSGLMTLSTVSNKNTPWQPGDVCGPLTADGLVADMGQAQSVFDIAEGSGTGFAMMGAVIAVEGDSSAPDSVVIMVQPAYVPAVVASGGVPNFADAETPTGVINSSNQVFTLAHTPAPGASLIFYNADAGGNCFFYINDPGHSGQQHTFQIAGNSATLTPAPGSGSRLYAFYRW